MLERSGARSGELQSLGDESRQAQQQVRNLVAAVSVVSAGIIVAIRGVAREAGVGAIVVLKTRGEQREVRIGFQVAILVAEFPTVAAVGPAIAIAETDVVVLEGKGLIGGAAGNRSESQEDLRKSGSGRKPGNSDATDSHLGGEVAL